MARARFVTDDLSRAFPLEPSAHRVTSLVATESLLPLGADVLTC
jgi:hypothetical protein